MAFVFAGGAVGWVVACQTENGGVVFGDRTEALLRLERCEREGHVAVIVATNELSE